MSTEAKAPAVGDPVFFEGLPHRVAEVDAEHDRVLIVSERIHDRVQKKMRDGSTVTVDRPAFMTVAVLSDLKWSSRYSLWYLYGRLLGKARGGIGDEQRLIVAKLRDRKLLAARPTRDRGSLPTAGEQLGLYYCLFSKPGINWRQEMANVERGEGLSQAAKEACAEFDTNIPCKFGYANPEDGDPYATKGGQ